MFIKSYRGEPAFCTHYELSNKRRYTIVLLRECNPNSDYERIAEAYSKGIAYRIYKDLLNIYDERHLAIM